MLEMDGDVINCTPIREPPCDSQWWYKNMLSDGSFAIVSVKDGRALHCGDGGRFSSSEDKVSAQNLSRENEGLQWKMQNGHLYSVKNDKVMIIKKEGLHVYTMPRDCEATSNDKFVFENIIGKTEQKVQHMWLERHVWRVICELTASVVIRGKFGPT